MLSRLAVASTAKTTEALSRRYTSDASTAAPTAVARRGCRRSKPLRRSLTTNFLLKRLSTERRSVDATVSARPDLTISILWGRCSTHNSRDI